MAKKAKALTTLALAHKTAGILFEKKCEDAVLLDLRGLSSVADYYLICTCQNEAQMHAVLNHTQRTLSREGIKSLRSEYYSGVRWAVLDYGDLIVHLFEKDTRNYYSLERLWADAKSVRLKPEEHVAVREKHAEDQDEDL